MQRVFHFSLEVDFFAHNVQQHSHTKPSKV
jgi:hypothetical protein